MAFTPTEEAQLRAVITAFESGKTILEIAASTEVFTTDVLEIVQSAVSKKATIAQIINLVNSELGIGSMSTKLSGIEAGSQVNVIESVKVNNTVLPISSKSVNVTVPTQPSDIGAEPALGFTPEQAGVAASLITALKNGVPTEGDTLKKLHDLIVASFSEVQVTTIAARDAYNITKLPTNVFVLDDGDSKWALYKATTTGVNATYVKLSDPDLLNAVMTASQIAISYESVDDVNRFTDALKAKLDAFTANFTVELKAAYDGKQNSLTIGNLTSTTSGVTIGNGTGAVIGSGATVNIATAGVASDGILTSGHFNTFNNKVSNATHTGDVTGSTALTLATVNSNVGTFNNVTINAKGLATAGSNVNYSTDIHWNIIALNSVSNTNTGDETLTSIKTKLGAATSVSDGYLKYQDWNTFNSKESAITKNTAFNKNFGTTTGTVLEGRTFGTAANSAVGDFQPIENQRLSTTNSPSFSSITSTVATGTAPLTVNSTTVVSNLNADLLRGYSPAVFHRHLGYMLSNQDFNTIGIGISESVGSSSNNSPAGAYGTLNTISTDSYYGWQMFMESNGSLYNRSKQASGWQPWRKIYDSGNLTNTLSTNYIPKWNGSSFVNSLISDDGTNVRILGGTQIDANQIGIPYNNTFYINSYNSGNGNVSIGKQSGGVITIPSTTPSTLPTNGALVVGGGVGAASSTFGDNANPPIKWGSTLENYGMLDWFSTGFAAMFGVSGKGLTLGANGQVHMLDIYNNGNTSIGYTADQGYKLAVNGTGYFNGNITASGEITAYSSSDIRLKQNIQPLNQSLELINKLNPVSYNWNEKAKELNQNKDEKKDVGVIAQELEKVLPNLVHNIYNDEFLAVDYVKLIPYLIGAIQELTDKINKLENNK